MTDKEKLELAKKAILIAIVRLKEIQYQKASYKQIVFLAEVLEKLES